MFSACAGPVEKAADELPGLTGKALLEASGCEILAETSDPAVMKVIQDKGWPTDRPVLVGCPSDSAVRPAMYIVHNELHTDGKVAMVPIDFMKDLATEWYATLTGGKKQVPILIVDGFVVGESIPMIKVLQTMFPGAAPISHQEAARIQRVEEDKPKSDALLKHFGFCRMAEGAKPYRNKGALTGEGLQWVKDQLKCTHALLSLFEGVLKDSKFLTGENLSAVDCASASTIGSLYHITEAPIDKNYPNCWRYYQDVKALYVERSDYPEISKTGCGFFTEFERFETFVKVFNCDRRAFAFCGGREALSNPTYWQGVMDAEVM